MKNFSGLIEVLNSNSKKFGGTGNHSNPSPLNISRKARAHIKLPAFSTLVFKEIFAEGANS